jgi:chromosome condensin MukBEF MukE localization factor
MKWLNQSFVGADVRRLKLFVQEEIRASLRRLLRFITPLRVLS